MASDQVNQLISCKYGCGVKVLNKDSGCRSCAQKERFKKTKEVFKISGENNHNYKDGRTNKKYYCIEKNCNNEISYSNWRTGNQRCLSCAAKEKFKDPKNHPNYKVGKYAGLLYCIEDCGKIVSIKGRRCGKCEAKRKHNEKILNFKNHKLNCKCACCKARRKEILGKNNPFYGKKHSEKTKKILSLSRGGNGTPYDYSEYGAEFDSSLKEQVRLRDGYKCQICGCSQLENDRQLCCHHIDYNKKNNVINNLISLCDSCHSKTVTNRNYWIEFFNNKKGNNFLCQIKQVN